jgi:CheY-like chemotaxis protein
LVVLSALRRVGYAPEAVTNGDDALTACEKQPFDVVFLDLGTSIDAAIELIGTLRGAEAPARRTPVIALTGRMGAGEKERCASSGFDDFLSKPIDLELLCATVDRWTRPATPVETTSIVEETPSLESTEEKPSAETPGLTELLERAPSWSAPETVDVERTPMWPRSPEVEAKTTPEEAPAPEPVPDITEAWVADGNWEAVPVLDASRIETSSMGNAELRSMLMDAFLTRTQQPLARLRLAHGAGDATQVEIQAHALEGLCSAIGAMRAASLFETIRSGATPERMAAIESLVARAEREVKLAMDSAEPRAEAA